LVKWLFYEAFVVPPLTVKATTSPKARRGHLTTDEAARRLDLSPARVQELARAGEIRGKIDGRWTFTEREIARMQGERDRRARRLSLTSTRPQKRTTRRRRSSSDSGSGRLTRADTQALGYLDQLLAEERRLEQTYSLPFRAPQRVATTVHACARCGQDLLLLIFGDQARDEEGLLAYGRLMREAIVARGLPAYVLGVPEGDGARDDTPSLLLRVWPEPDEPRRVTPGEKVAVIPARPAPHFDVSLDGGGRMEDERGAGRGGETPCAGSALPRQRSTLSDHGPLAP